MEKQNDTQKDMSSNQRKSGLDQSQSVALPKAKLEKLVTAIFMVTDLMDKEEPLRNKLRTLSLDLLTNTYQLPAISYQLMSLINISTSIGLISDMNGSIINKELANLNDSIPTLESFNFDVLYKTPSLSLSRNLASSIQPKAVLKEVQRTVLKNPNESKNDRRENILKLIRDTSTKLGAGNNGVTIKDISSNISECSEKTIQRELISLLKDNVIKKTGEKRWSKYYI